jgi:hypothetical protein
MTFQADLRILAESQGGEKSDREQDENREN